MIDRADTSIQLKSGQAVVLPLGPGFALGGEATLVFQVHPARTPAPHGHQPAYGPNVLRCGTEADPASVFGIRLGGEHPTIFVGSEKTGLTPLGPVRNPHAPIYVFFAGGQAWLGDETSRASPKVDLELGDLPPGLPPRLTLGGVDDDGTYPFEGTIASIMLFDADVTAALAAQPPHAQLIPAWLAGATGIFLRALNHARASPLAASLYGVALPSRGEFDVIPREMLWPPPVPARWMLDHGKEPPKPTIVIHAEDQSRQGIYTTNHLYCFVRLHGVAMLWSDSGHCIRVEYAGRNQFTGVLVNDGMKAVTLDFQPGRLGHPDALVITPVGGWNNTTEKFFVTTPFPQGTQLHALEGVTDQAAAERLIWPEDIKLLRLADDYNKENDDAEPPVQAWTDTFAGKPNQLATSMCGWDLTALTNPFNPIQSGPAERDQGYFLFEPPRGTAYRANGNLPYYLFNFPISGGQDASDQRAYRSMREFSDKLSWSVGAGFGMGDINFFDASFSTEVTSSTAVHTEHAVTVQYAKHLKFAGLLSKQWMTLNPRFITDLLDAIGSHYLTAPAPGLPPPQPAILTPPAEGARNPHEKLYPVFKDWGTHYPNAITYGYCSYSIGLIDDASLTEMGSSTMKGDVSLTIPLEEVFVKLKGSVEKGKSHKVETGNHTEIYCGMTAGQEHDEVPMLLDLRPVWELLQPPYVNNTRVASAAPYVQDILDALPHIKAAWSEYIALFKKMPPDGNILFDIRLVSVTNHGPNPCWLNARADLGAMRTGPDKDADVWRTDLPHIRIPLWADTTRHIAPGETATPSVPGATRLAAPASSLDGTAPTLFLAGVINEVDMKAYGDTFLEWQEAPPIGGIKTGMMIPIMPADIDVPAEADAMARRNEVPLDTFGPPPDWAHGAYHRRLETVSALLSVPADGSLQTVSITDGSLEATFEIRKLDIGACWQLLHAQGVV